MATFPVASPALLGQFTRGYVRRVEDFIQQQQLPVVHFKQGRAAPTEGTISDPLDFGAGKALKNLPHLKQPRASTSANPESWPSSRRFACF